MRTCGTVRQERVDNSDGVAALGELAVHVVMRGAVDHEHLRHVVSQQLARVPNVYRRLWKYHSYLYNLLLLALVPFDEVARRHIRIHSLL